MHESSMITSSPTRCNQSKNRGGTTLNMMLIVNKWRSKQVTPEVVASNAIEVAPNAMWSLLSILVVWAWLLRPST